MQTLLSPQPLLLLLLLLQSIGPFDASCCNTSLRAAVSAAPRKVAFTRRSASGKPAQ
jgi:hypothetical protein